MKTNPPDTLTEALTWTPETVHDTTDALLAAGPDGTALPGLKASANAIQAALLPDDLSRLSARDRAAAGSLAMAATLQELAVFCTQFAEAAVRDARDLGATWAQVATATGYTTPGNAAQRFDPKQRAKALASQRRKDRKTREAAKRAENT